MQNRHYRTEFFVISNIASFTHNSFLHTPLGLMHQHKTKASLKYLMVIMKVKLNDWYILDRWCPSMSLRSLLLCFAFPSLPGTICITVLHGHCISTFVFMKMQWFIIRFGTFFFFKCKNQSNKESWIALCYISSTFEQVG